jgi:catalase
MNKKLATAFGIPVDHNWKAATAGNRRPQLLRNIRIPEKMAHFDRGVISGCRMPAAGSRASGTVTISYDVSKYTKAKTFSEISLNRESKELCNEQVPR